MTDCRSLTGTPDEGSGLGRVIASFRGCRDSHKPRPNKSPVKVGQAVQLLTC
jgi:hypothetical protein